MGPHEEIWLYTDGASRGNPGPAAAGFLITDDSDRSLAERAECIGSATNNRAEYEALLRGLAECARFTTSRVRCISDSELLVRQMRGEFRVRNPGLSPLHQEARRRERRFAEVTYTHERRTEPHIARVDRLVNHTLDACAPARR